MTLAELIRRFRVLAKDTVLPGFWKDPDITDWLNDAQAQAAVRGRLLLEDANPAVCLIAVTAGQHTYPLHRALYELVGLWFKPAGASRATPLKLVSREWLEREVRDWRDTDSGLHYAIQDETSIRLVGVPERDGALMLEGYRLPLAPMATDTDKPDIHEASHEHLIQWALHKAFSIPDAQSFDPERSALAERAFTAYFGLLPDADMRRITRSDTDHANQVHAI